jgi:hypothetical protein
VITKAARVTLLERQYGALNALLEVQVNLYPDSTEALYELLHTAIANDDEQAVCVLAQNSHDMNRENKDGEHPPHLAVCATI